MQEVEVEVESQKMAERRQALENYSKAVEEQRNRLGQVTMRLAHAFAVAPATSSLLRRNGRHCSSDACFVGYTRYLF